MQNIWRTDIFFRNERGSSVSEIFFISNSSPRVFSNREVSPFTSGNKRYTFETSRQTLTSIDTTRWPHGAHCSLFTVNPCYSLLFVNNSMLLIVKCLKWGMHVWCENQCVGKVGLLLCSFCCLNWCSMCKNVSY